VELISASLSGSLAGQGNNGLAELDGILVRVNRDLTQIRPVAALVDRMTLTCAFVSTILVTSRQRPEPSPPAKIYRSIGRISVYGDLSAREASRAAPPPIADRSARR
jgi:hypothetical protein